MKYLVVLEPTPTGFSAFSPDLPGCIATGDTREEVEREIAEAIAFISKDSVKKACLFLFRTLTQPTSKYRRD